MGEDENMVVTFGLVNALQWSFIGGLLAANTTGMYQPNLKKDKNLYQSCTTYSECFYMEKDPFIVNSLMIECKLLIYCQTRDLKYWFFTN